MEFSRTLLYFLTVLSLTSCFPSRPLNERSTELALQAWILFEQDQQDNVNNDHIHQLDDGSQFGGHRRRITPKSVFLVPTFSPDTLPPCADGYKADAMGRCLKIVKIDNSAHLDYLFKVLMQKFHPNPNETKTSDKPVSVSIPLPEEKPQEMLIVVTGSNETKDGSSSSVDSLFAVDESAESGGLVDNVSKQDEETTTIDNTDTTTLQEQTTMPPEDNTSTEEVLTTTTDPIETTTFENQALFFFNADEDNGTEDTPTTTSEASSTAKTKGLPEASHLNPLFSSESDTDVKQSSNFVRFPTDDEFPSYASRFKHEYKPSFFKDDVENDDGDVDDDGDDDFGSDEYRSSWSSSQLGFRFPTPTHYRHSGRDFHSESYYRGFPGGSDVAHLFRHRPRGRFR